MNNDPKITVARNIKDLMSLKKVTRNQLASDLNIKYSTLCEWLKGNKMPRPEKLELIASYFDVTVDRIFLEKDTQFINDNNGLVYFVYDYIPANVDFNNIPEERVVKTSTLLFNNEDNRFSIKISNIYDCIYSKFALGDEAKFIGTNSIDESDKFYLVRTNNCPAMISKVLVTDNEYIFIPAMILKGQKENTIIIKKENCDIEIFGKLKYISLNI